LTITPLERELNDLKMRLRAYRQALRGNLQIRRDKGTFTVYVTLEDGSTIILAEGHTSQKEAKTAATLKLKRAMPALGRRYGKLKKQLLSNSQDTIFY